MSASTTNRWQSGGYLDSVVQQKIFTRSNSEVNRAGEVLRAWVSSGNRVGDLMRRGSGRCMMHSWFSMSSGRVTRIR